jgi:hypothetical protein
MNTIEERVRDAFRAADTWTPDTPPPFPQRGTRTIRWAAPLAAAAALLLVVGAAYLVTRRTSDHVVGSRPAYVLAREPGDRGWTSVRDSVTGRVVARLPITAEQVAATGDGHTFFAASVAVDLRKDASQFFKIVLRGDGRLRSMTRLGLPGVHARVESLTANADGTKLAYGVQGSNPRGALYLADVATGQITRLWSLAGSVITSTSMDREGRRIAFIEAPLSSGGPKVRVLDLAHPGKKPVVVPLDRKEYPDAVGMRPDGAAVAVGQQGGDNPDRIVEYPLAGGRPRVVVTAPLVTEEREGGKAIITGVSVVDYDRDGHELLAATTGIPLSRVSVETGRTTLIGDPRWAKFHIIAAW